MIGTWIFYCLGVLTGSAVESLYVARTTANKTMHFYRIARLALTATAAYVLFVYAIKFPPRLFVASRAVVLLLFVIWLWMYVLVRILALPHLLGFCFRLFRCRKIRLLYCGDPKVIRNIRKTLANSALYRAVLVVAGECDACEKSPEDRLSFYFSRVGETGANQMCVVDEDADFGLIAAFVMECRKRGLPVVFYSPRFIDLRFYDSWLSSSSIGAMPFFHGAWTKTGEAVWRIVDFLAALLAILVLSPILIAVAALVKLTSRGPVLFVQKRVCKDMQVHDFPKFRSMLEGRDERAERAHKEYFRKYAEGKAVDRDENGEGVYKLDQTKRVTAIGRVIRRMSIDELPQVFCVLGGSMSVVGPRPCIPYELEHYSTWQLERFGIKPGLTGTWQVYGRSRLPFDAAQFLDFCYVYRRSYAMNVRLVLKTFPVMLFGRGGV